VAELEFYESSVLGWLLVFCILGGGMIYIGGGIAYGQRVQGGGGGRGSAMLTAHPHHSKWAELARLCKDGLAFARGRRAGYNALPIVDEREKRGRSGGKGDNESVHKTTTARSKKEKKDKKDKKDKKETVERAGVNTGASDQVKAAAAGSVNPAPSSAVGTKAGDGGRWVHVPN